MDRSLKRITKVAVMAAIIFVFTYTFKIPIAVTNGYTHLGDCAIFVGVMILGRRDGVLAAAIGAALSDLLGGFLLWVIPTFVIKGIMAFVMGTVIEKALPEKKGNWLVGAILGGICQIVGYQLVKIVLISPAAALATIPTISLQTAVGIVVGAVIIRVLNASRVMGRLQAM